jgi:hypothetical protein
MADFNSSFTVFIEKFKNSKGLVNATIINNAGIARTENSQYRRNLLAHAVSKEMARSNGEHYTHNKYGIYFNTVEESKPERIHFFDSEVLLSPLILDMPPRAYLEWGLSFYQHALWVHCKEEWTEVYRAFCMYQNEGKITYKRLNFRGDKRLGKYRLIMIELYIAIYEAIRIGWDDPMLADSGLEPDHNKFFVECLYNESIFDFVDSIEPLEEPMKYRTTYNSLIELRNHEAAGKYSPIQYDRGYEAEREALEKANEFLTRRLKMLGTEREELTPPFSQIIYCLEQSTNSQVLEAAKKWRKAEKALGDFTINLLRPLKESKNNRDRVFLDAIRKL